MGETRAVDGLRVLLSGDVFECILLVPRKEQGTSLLSQYAAEFGGALGVRVHTPLSLAAELCSRYDPKALWEDVQAVAALRRVILRAVEQQEGEMAYFTAMAAQAQRWETAWEVLRCLQQYEGRVPQGGSPRHHAMAWLYGCYQAEKGNRRDRYDLYRDAAALLAQHPLELPVICTSDLEGQGAMKAFILALGGTVLHLPTTEQVEKGHIFSQERVVLPKTTKLRLTQGYGAENETRFPLYDLLERRIPFGDAVILCADQSYPKALWAQCRELGIPATLGTGLPMSENPVLGLLEQMEQWHREGCRVEGLPGLLAGGLYVPEYVALLNALRRENVGWDLERYCRCTSAHLRAAQERPMEKEQENKEAATWQQLHDFCAALRELLSPQPISQQLHRLRTFLHTYYNRKDPWRGAAWAGFVVLLQGLEGMEEPGDFGDLMALIHAAAKRRTWMGGSPQSDAVFITALNRGHHTGRNHTYILGLGRDSLRRGVWESPLLTEEDRAAMGLPQADAEADLPRSAFGQALGCARGEVTLSYSNFDGEKMVALPPASRYLALQGLEGVTVLPAFHYRRTQAFTPYDVVLRGDQLPSVPAAAAPGALKKEEGELALGGHLFSASSLEKALHCPLAFFLSYQLRIPDQPQVLLEAGRWLPANVMGTVVHEVMERYCMEFAGNQSPKLEDILEETLERWRQNFPCVNPALMASDEERLRSMAQGAVAQYHEALAWEPGRRTLATELTFGKKTETPSTLLGQAMPQDFVLHLGQRQLRFTGSVDRLDALDAEGKELVIVDYKSGNPANFDRELKAGKKLQYYLYALAVEQICEALFPGKGCRVVRWEYELVQEEQTVALSGSMDTASEQVVGPVRDTVTALLTALEDRENIQSQMEATLCGSMEGCPNGKCGYRELCKEVLCRGQ